MTPPRTGLPPRVVTPSRVPHRLWGLQWVPHGERLHHGCPGTLRLGQSTEREQQHPLLGTLLGDGVGAGMGDGGDAPWVLADARAHSRSPGCDTAARPVPPGDGPRGWSSSLVEAPAKQNPAGKGGSEGAVHPTGALWLLPLTVTSLLAGLPRMWQGNCRRSEVRARAVGLVPRGVPPGLCTSLARLWGPQRSWGALSLSDRASGLAPAAGTSGHPHPP